MNLLEAELMKGPSIETETCAFCGRAYPLNKHHIVRRSAGGGDGPTVVCCGFGSNLRDADGRYYCHGLLHAHMLHVRLVDGEWWYLRTKEPTKYEKALEMDGWLPLRKIPYIRTVAGGDFGEIAY